MQSVLSTGESKLLRLWMWGTSKQEMSQSLLWVHKKLLFSESRASLNGECWPVARKLPVIAYLLPLPGSYLVLHMYPVLQCVGGRSIAVVLWLPIARLWWYSRLDNHSFGLCWGYWMCGLRALVHWVVCNTFTDGPNLSCSFAGYLWTRLGVSYWPPWIE